MWSFSPGLVGPLLTIRRSNTDQYADGQVVAVVHGQHAVTDPFAASDAWLGHRGPDPGRLFTSMRNQTVTREPISGEALSIVLRKRARAAGLAAERITAHSLRAGHATSAAVAGVAVDRIAAQTRHKRLSTSSTITSARPKPCSTPPAATSDYETTERPASSALRVLSRPSA